MGGERVRDVNKVEDGRKKVLEYVEQVELLGVDELFELDDAKSDITNLQNELI